MLATVVVGKLGYATVSSAQCTHAYFVHILSAAAVAERSISASHMASALQAYHVSPADGKLSSIASVQLGSPGAFGAHELFRSLSVCIRLISKLCLYDEELCILLGMYM